MVHVHSLPLSSRYRKSIPTTTETFNECTHFPTHMCRQHRASNRPVFLDATSSSHIPQSSFESSEKGPQKRHATGPSNRSRSHLLLICSDARALKGPRRHRGIAEGCGDAAGSNFQVRYFFIERFYLPKSVKVHRIFDVTLTQNSFFYEIIRLFNFFEDKYKFPFLNKRILI